MKILIVTEVFYPENFTINDFALELVNRGYEVEVMTRQPSYPSGYVYKQYNNDRYSVEDWNGIKIHRFDIIEGYKDSFIKKVRNYIHYVNAGKKLIFHIAKGADRVLIHQTGPLTLALPAIYVRKKLGIKTIIWTFDIWPDTVYGYGFPRIFPIIQLLNYIIKKVYRNVDSVLISSKMFRNTIIHYAPNQTITYAPNWLIPVDNKQSDIEFSADKINFTFTGNISLFQNLNNIILGFAESNLENAVLHIIGDGSSLEQHINLVMEKGIKNVIFYGRRPYNQMNDILSKSDFLVISLISNGVDKTEPFKLQSYLDAGKPILGAIKGAGRSIIEENHLGICSDPDNVEDIAKAFRSICSLSDEERVAIAERANELKKTRFNRDVIISNVIKVLDE